LSRREHPDGPTSSSEWGDLEFHPPESQEDWSTADATGTTGLPEPEPQPARTGGELEGRVAIVTGGSSGIGRAVANQLAEAGAHIAFNYLDDGTSRTRREAQRVAADLERRGVKVLCRSCNVRDSSRVQQFVDDAYEELGGIHILVNNAGIGRDRAFWRMTDEEWKAVLETNLDGAFYFTRAVAPVFRYQEQGKIVNVTSVHGIRSEFGLANYASSKAGLIGLTRSTAVELGPSNVNVNAVAPGYIRTTRLTESVPAEILDRARERSVLGRLGDPADVAGVVVFLCSEAARHITGAVIPVDAGYLL
jgi:3-oxoacyl-[acyl-carrier protein] reductase